MDIKVNNTSLAKAPSKFAVTVMDLDDGESTQRASDGLLTRDRIAVKRKIQIGWDLLSMADASSVLSAFQDVFFDVTYPDPMVGSNVTKNFYAADRPASVAIDMGTGIYWSGIEFTLIER